MAATPAKATTVVDTEPTNTPDKFSYKHATFDEVLEDLSSRFILNLPEDELAEVERVCFQVEQAHWYYEDFIREENPSFASLPLKRFSEILFRSCPLLHHWSHDHETAFNGFMSYKTRVPVCGAIMLNDELTKCVLVKGWKSSAGWGFPKGKVNENEDEAFCAVREVLEETGYNLSGQIRQTDCIQLCVKQQPITLFVVAGVPEDYPFKTQTRKEISKIDWFRLTELPTWKKNRSTINKFYLITPAVGPLKAIVRNLRKTRGVVKPQTFELTDPISLPAEDEDAEDAETTVRVESLATAEHEASSQGQSGETEISSSQSSSIDPHTPSVNGDLGPHSASGDKLVFKQNYPDMDEIALDAGLGMQIGITTSDFNPDPRTHWSRLMTRLNHSEESSPHSTPQAVTPTPPIPESLPKLGPSHESFSHRDPERAVETVQDRSVRRPLSTMRIPSSSTGSERSASTTSLLPRGLPTPSALAPSPDLLVKRTRQLQLLESVVAEGEARRSPHLVPPMSAHILGAYPRPSSVMIPDQARTPLRSASVNPDVPRNQYAPSHHQHTHSVSSFSGVLPSQVSSSLQHQMFRAPYGHSPNILPAGRGARLATALPPQLHPYPPSSSPLAPPPVGRNASMESAHKGQMLSILSSGGSNLARSSTFATQGSPSPHGSCSSTSTAGPRGNSHLLSILNNTSPTRPANPQHARQLQGG